MEDVCVGFGEGAGVGAEACHVHSRWARAVAEPADGQGQERKRGGSCQQPRRPGGPADAEMQEWVGAGAVEGFDGNVARAESGAWGPAEADRGGGGLQAARQHQGEAGDGARE